MSLVTRDTLCFCSHPLSQLLDSLFWQLWQTVHYFLSFFIFFFLFSPWDAAICCKLSCGPEEAIFINDSVDLAWIALCLLLNKKGGPALCFICHRCFSLARQCSIVSMKISGSMQRRARYYYVPAKFRSLFSFFCLQRAHNLLSTMRQATKLHCCSANRLVLVDGLTRCEVCLSAEAAEGSLGTRFPLQAQRKRRNKRKQEKQKARTASGFSCLGIPPPTFPFSAGEKFG